MTTKLSVFPDTDPEEVKEDATSMEKKPKRRKRRTKAQIAADKEAQALGFKDAADQQAQEAKMGESQVSEGEPQAGGSGVQPVAEDIVQDTGPQDTGPKSGFTYGGRWNLGGSTYCVTELHDDGSVTFKPVV